MRIAVISANFGDFDEKYTHIKQVLPEGWTLNYYTFDDETFPCRSLAMSDRLKGKIPKILGHELISEHDYYIWVDSNIRFNSPVIVNILVQTLINDCNNILLFRHPHRSTLRQEFDFMSDRMDNDPYIMKRYEGELIHQQQVAYRKVLNNQLYIGGIFVYNRELIELGVLKEWFYQCCRYSVQDQISLPYVLNDADVSITSLDWDFCDERHLKYHWSHS